MSDKKMPTLKVIFDPDGIRHIVPETQKVECGQGCYVVEYVPRVACRVTKCTRCGRPMEVSQILLDEFGEAFVCDACPFQKEPCETCGKDHCQGECCNCETCTSRKQSELATLRARVNELLGEIEVDIETIETQRGRIEELETQLRTTCISLEMMDQGADSMRQQLHASTRRVAELEGIVGLADTMAVEINRLVAAGIVWDLEVLEGVNRYTDARATSQPSEKGMGEK
jgi:hypothetical protein